MTKYLQLSIRYPSGRYCGNMWPPPPTQLFQAIVNGANNGCHKLAWADNRKVLLWLEQRCGVPQISAANCFDAVKFTDFCPNNQITSKNDAKIATALYLDKNIKVVPKEEIGRQVRNLDVDHNAVSLVYCWRLPEQLDPYEEDMPAAFCRVAEMMFALGRGIDAVIPNAEIMETFSPPDGHVLYRAVSKNSGELVMTCPIPGYLQALEQNYSVARQRNRFVDKTRVVSTESNTLRYAQRVEYATQDNIIGPDYLVFKIEKHDVFEYEPWQDSMLVAARTRHAAIGRLSQDEWGTPDEIKSYVAGHGDKNERLSYVPIPNIGYGNRDGKHRRVMVVLPRSTSNPEEVKTYLERMSGDKLECLDDHDQENGPVLSLDDPNQLMTLYTKRSHVWATVAPMVLPARWVSDGIKGRVVKPGEDRSSPGKIRKLVLKCLAASGIPPAQVLDIQFQQAPYWKGTGSAGQVRVSKKLEEYHRCHIKVVFRTKVQGPLIAGPGKHYGLGLFAAVE